MESLIAKCIQQYGGQSMPHVSAAVMRSERIVAEISGAEVASYELADIDDTGQLPPFGNNPITKMSLSPDSLQIDVELRGSLRSRRPWAMQSPAFSRGTQELFAPAAGRLFEEMGNVPTAIIFQFCFSELSIVPQTVSADRHPAEHQMSLR